jgi:hypothetical protein
MNICNNWLVKAVSSNGLKMTHCKSKHVAIWNLSFYIYIVLIGLHFHFLVFSIIMHNKLEYSRLNATLPTENTWLPHHVTFQVTHILNHFLTYTFFWMPCFQMLWHTFCSQPKPQFPALTFMAVSELFQELSVGMILGRVFIVGVDSVYYHST